MSIFAFFANFGQCFTATPDVAPSSQPKRVSPTNASTNLLGYESQAKVLAYAASSMVETEDEEDEEQQQISSPVAPVDLAGVDEPVAMVPVPVEQAAESQEDLAEDVANADDIEVSASVLAEEDAPTETDATTTSEVSEKILDNDAATTAEISEETTPEVLEETAAFKVIDFATEPIGDSDTESEFSDVKSRASSIGSCCSDSEAVKPLPGPIDYLVKPSPVDEAEKAEAIPVVDDAVKPEETVVAIEEETPVVAVKPLFKRGSTRRLNPYMSSFPAF